MAQRNTYREDEELEEQINFRDILRVGKYLKPYMAQVARILVVVISSAAERSFLHCGQYHIGTGRETTPWCYVFLLSHMHRLSVCKEDFSLRSK